MTKENKKQQDIEITELIIDTMINDLKKLKVSLINNRELTDEGYRRKTGIQQLKDKKRMIQFCLNNLEVA